MTMLMKCLNCN